MVSHKFKEGDIVRDKFGNEFRINAIYGLNVNVTMIKHEQDVMALTIPFGRYWFTKPGDAWMCLAFNVHFEPDAVTDIDPCEYLLRLNEVEVL